MSHFANLKNILLNKTLSFTEIKSENKQQTDFRQVNERNPGPKCSE